jgi:hypothetical protein
MTAPSLLLAARQAPDRRERIIAMAYVMRDLEYAPCTDAHLRAAGFTDAEIEVYQPEAVGVIHGRPSPLRTIPIGRLKGLALASRAKAIRHRNEGRGARA